MSNLQEEKKEFKEALRKMINTENIKTISQKILSFMETVYEDFQEGYSFEYVWALIKNAQSDKPLTISIEINDKDFIFKHDGKAFSVEDLACLIKQQSNKYKNKQLRHGTNFLNCHILSEKVEIDTKITHNKLKRIKYEIDRSDKEIQNLSKKIEESINKIEFLKQQKKQLNYVTKFTFVNYKKKQVFGEQSIIIEFKKLIPYILIFNQNIGKLYFKTTKQDLTFSRIQRKKNLFQFNHLIIQEQNNKSKQEKQYYFAYQGQSVVVPIKIIQKNIQIIEIGQSPKLFKKFPIQGQEIGYNVVINSEEFQINRKNKLIDRKIREANVEIFSDIMDSIQTLLNKLSKYTVNGRHLLFSNNHLKSNYVVNIENRYLKFATQLKFLSNKQLKSLKQVNWIKCSDCYLNEKDKRILYSLSIPLIEHFQNEEQYKKCLNVIQSNYAVFKKGKIKQYSIEQLVNSIQNLGFFKLNDRISEVGRKIQIIQYLNDFYEFLLSNYPRAITEYVDQAKSFKIFLNQNNQFVEISKLHMDTGIPQLFKTYLQQNNIKNYRSILLNKSIASKILSRKINVEQVFKKITEFFELESDESTLNDHKLILLFKFLISYSKDQQNLEIRYRQKIELRRKMFKVYKNIKFLFLETIKQIKLQENLNIDYQPFIKKFVRNIDLRVSQASQSKDTLKDFLNKDTGVYEWYTQYYLLSKELNNYISIQTNLNQYGNFIAVKQLVHLSWDLNKQEESIYKEYYKIIKYKNNPQQEQQLVQPEDNVVGDNKQIIEQQEKSIINLGQDLKVRLLNKNININNFKDQNIKFLNFKDFFEDILKLFKKEIQNGPKAQYDSFFKLLANYYIELQDQSQRQSQMAKKNEIATKLKILDPIKINSGDILIKYMLSDSHKKQIVFKFMQKPNQLEYIEKIRRRTYNFQTSYQQLLELDQLRQKARKMHQQIQQQTNIITNKVNEIKQLQKQIQEFNSERQKIQQKKIQNENKQKKIKQDNQKLNKQREKNRKQMKEKQEQVNREKEKNKQKDQVIRSHQIKISNNQIEFNKLKKEIESLNDINKLLEKQKLKITRKNRQNQQEIERLILKQKSLQKQIKEKKKQNLQEIEIFSQEQIDRRDYKSKLMVIKQQLEKQFKNQDVSYQLWGNGIFKFYNQKKLIRTVLVFISKQGQNLYKIFTQDIQKIRQIQGLNSNKQQYYFCIYQFTYNNFVKNSKYYSLQELKVMENYVEFDFRYKKCKNEFQQIKKKCNSDLKFQVSLKCYKLLKEELFKKQEPKVYNLNELLSSVNNNQKSQQLDKSSSKQK